MIGIGMHPRPALLIALQRFWWDMQRHFQFLSYRHSLYLQQERQNFL